MTMPQPIPKVREVDWIDDRKELLYGTQRIEEPTPVVITDGSKFQFLIAEAYIDELTGKRRVDVKPYEDDSVDELLGFTHWAICNLRFVLPRN